MLSKADKEILVKAVAQVIPTYAMSCFDQQNKEHKLHWLSWETLKRPKDNGGLGFRDLHGFNMAMLAKKQGWRIVQSPDSLCGRILRAKYFPSGNFAGGSSCGQHVLYLAERVEGH